MNKTTNVQDIVRGWLELNGFDGLVHDDTNCGCHLDDFILCGECFSECRPAYKFTEKDGSWWMSTNKNYTESVDEE